MSLSFSSPVLLAALATALLGSVADATTFIVDDDGGTGISFTDIPPAVQAAAPGDVIIVFPGTYSGFTLSQGVTIFGAGSPDVNLTGPAIVSAVPAGQTAVLQGFRSGDVQIQGCQGTVIVVTVRAYFTIQSSTDVRLHDITLIESSPVDPPLELVMIETSRVEIVRCQLLANQNGVTYQQYAINGQPAIRCGDGSRVHIASTTCRGGAGFDNWMNPSMPPFHGYGGNGAPGVFVHANAEVVIAGGGESLFQGGEYGWANVPFQFCMGDGDGGAGLQNAGGSVWYSEATFEGGYQCCNGPFGSTCDFAQPIVGNAIEVAPVEPALLREGSFAPGGTSIYTLHGRPGSLASLTFGYAPAVGANDQMETIGRLTSPWPFFTANLGIVPASGTVSFQLTIPAIPVGTLLLAQGKLQMRGAPIRRSNSVPSVVE